MAGGVVVRVGERLKSWMKAGLVGPPDTPCADVMFFFDTVIRDKYQTEPSYALFHSQRRCVIINLVEYGMMCSSLLGTENGYVVERWDFRDYNLHRLLQIQPELVLVEAPY